MAESQVVCPACGHRFPVTKALTDQIEASLRIHYEAEARRKEKADEAAFAKRLEAERGKIEQTATLRATQASATEVRKLQALLAEAEKRGKKAQAEYDRKLAAEKTRLEREADTRAKSLVTNEMADLRRQIGDKDTKLKDLQKLAASMQQRENQLREKEQEIQKTITRAVEVARKKAIQETSETIEQENRTRELQHQKIVADLRQQLTEVKRKLDQSSQQSQGEVMELELEKLLSAAFPDDDIRAVAKGKLGADIIHRVISGSGQHCGTIVWESKNTKNWNQSWLAKLKADQRREKAEVAVIVSAVLPKDLNAHFGQISGIWVADFSVVLGLATALRANIVEVARVRMTADGKSEKMEAVYQYLLSTEFRQRVEAIVEAFISMRDDLHKEKQVAEKNWAKREMHLSLVLQNVAGMIGEIQAITPAFPRIKRLELPAPRRLDQSDGFARPPA